MFLASQIYLTNADFGASMMLVLAQILYLSNRCSTPITDRSYLIMSIILNFIKRPPHLIYIIILTNIEQFVDKLWVARGSSITARSNRCPESLLRFKSKILINLQYSYVPIWNLFILMIFFLFIFYFKTKGTEKQFFLNLPCHTFLNKKNFHSKKKNNFFSHEGLVAHSFPTDAVMIVIVICQLAQHLFGFE